MEESGIKKNDGEMCEETHCKEDLLTDIFFQVHLVFLCQWVAAAGISPKTGKCDFLSGPLLQQEFTIRRAKEEAREGSMEKGAWG
jgi:hypothetical protein